MAVKAKNRKRNRLKESYEKAIKIKCCYCELNNNCDKQRYKENSEKLGFTTYCTLTPNIPKKQKKKRALNNN